MPVKTDLKPESLGLVSVTMQAITHIAPAIAALFFTQFLVTLSGVTAPLAYFIGVLVVLMLGNTLIQFSRQLPSAGGYYTYVSRSLGSRVGFLTAWMFILYSPMAGGVVSGFFGFIAAGELKAEKKSGLNVHARTGLPCPRCGDEIREVSFATKSFQYCPTCQTGGKPLADRRMSKLLK